MTAYYNEIDPHAAQWLRNLIEAGHIAPGFVDERSIVDVRPDDLLGYSQVHFFAGIGGWSYALRLAGWPDHRPAWTGSCPCQPFSLAGAQKGFDDARHLWPVFRELIRERRPAKVFGEQVASATAWLGLVRGDLEAMGYAVGAIPVEAASAGADHLRDRYWFVADADYPGSQGREVLPERSGERTAGPDGLADADGDAVWQQSGRGSRARGAGAGIDRNDSQGDVADSYELGAGEERQQRGGKFSGAGRDQEACVGGVDLAITRGDGAGCRTGSGLGSQAPTERKHWRASGAGIAARLDGEDFEWAIGADGKARRVKPGIRLLAHGVPGRVGLLRGFGNAIDPRPAAEFIRACM